MKLIVGMPNIPIIANLHYLCNISKTKGRKLIFCIQIKCQTILQVDTINLGGHGQAMLAQITQSSKFTKTLQYLKKEVRDEVDFYCKQHRNFI